MSQQFCLKWNNHMNNMMDVFKNLLSTESMVDVTLACDGLSLKAHKMVLSACSPFFQSLFLENPCKHPIVILKDMKYSELKAIIEFMYHGEVNVAQDQLSALMKTAETLRVKGLAEVTNEKNSQSSNSAQDEPGHRSVPRTETPPPQSKRRKGRVRKRSLSDSNRSEDSNEPKIKQPVSPDIEELSGDVTMDNSIGQFSNLQSQVPMQSLPSHTTNSFHKTSSVVSQDPQIEEPTSADESEFGVEPAKLLEQTLTTDDLSNRRSSRSTLSSAMEMQRRPRSSTDHSSLVPSSMPSEALGSNQQPESPPDIKPELLELDPPMSPVAGPSHSTDNSMMMYMDQSSVSSHPGTSYQDNQALVPQDSQPQGSNKLMDSLVNCSKESTYQVLKKYIPILSWLPEYSFKDFKGDFIAGFTVGLTVVPQGLALAQLANLPPQYGLYTAFMGSFMYAVFGTCKDLVIGPTSVMALMTAEYVQIGGPAYAALLAFLCGCFQLLLGIFNLGFLMNFISSTVLSGFTSAAAIITATMQLKGIFGLKFQSRGFVNTVYKFFLNISHTNFYDLAMGLSSIVFLLLLRKYKDRKSTCCSYVKGSHALQGLWWSFATARNALLVVLCSGFASAWLSIGSDVFSLTQHVDAGIPNFQMPQFSFQHFDPVHNETIYKGFIEVFKDLGSGAVVIPFISLLEAVAIAKTFTRGGKLFASREMIALGMGNLMGSFVSSYPVTGSFSRSVINNASGVKTPLGGIISGSFVLLALCVIAPLFHYIPKSCLSAIIFSAVIFMIHYEDVPEIWKTNKLELIPFMTTFICSFVFGLEYGLLFGIVIALGMLMWKQNKVSVSVSTKKDENEHTFIHVTPECSVYFPSSDNFKGIISKALYSQPNISKCTVIVHGDNFKDIDYTTAMGIRNMVKSVKKDNAQVLFHATEPLALKALNCLTDSVSLYMKEDEIQHALLSSPNKTLLSSPSSCTEGCFEGTEVVESSSADALLAKQNTNKMDALETLNHESER